MAEPNKPRHASQRRLVKAVQAEFDRVARDIRPQLAEMGVLNDQMLAINTAQNTLRTCMEATLNRMLPYDADMLVELAIRLASYAISAAPMEDQEIHVARFMGVFADAHLKRISEGKVIGSVWEMNDGREQPNFPEQDR